MPIKVNFYVGGVSVNDNREIYGTRRYVVNVLDRLSNKVDSRFIGFKISSKIPLSIQKFVVYPFKIYMKKKSDENCISFFTSPDLAFFLNFLNFKNSVVICYDLIQYLRKEYFGSPFTRAKMKLSLLGMKKADRIIAISEYTKQQITYHLNYPSDRIDVAYPGVELNRFKPLEINDNVLKKYNLSSESKLILYVGSEQPRMNLERLLKAFYELKKKCPCIKLLKVGRPQWVGAREKLIYLTKKLNIINDVIFIDCVSDKDLVNIYNIADLLVYPILDTGFGLPPLEAMACGTPVITSNLVPLPEVVGDAGILVNPYDVGQLGEAMLKVLTDGKLNRELTRKGLERAKQFTWENTAEKVMETFKKILT